MQQSKTITERSSEPEVRQDIVKNNNLTENISPNKSREGLLSGIKSSKNPRIRLISENVILLHEACTLLIASENKWAATYGLSSQKINLLLLLTSVPDKSMSMSEISEYMLVTGGSITKMVDSLEATGIVQRIRVPGDRRVVFVKLTNYGCELFDRVDSEHCKYCKEIWSEVLDDDLATLKGLLLSVKRISSKRRIS
jgi:DNA-binding MarR family transcriptional regulator